jgi:L-malate glycosyltransferase
MKILELCLSYGYGGLELYSIKVARFLNHNDYDCKVIAKKNTFLDSKLKEIKIFPEYLNVKFSIFPIIEAIKLAKYLEKNKIDIIHIHWRFDFLLSVLAKTLSKRPVKLVYTRHMALTRKKSSIYHKFLYRNVDAYLTVTQGLRNIAEKYLPLSKNKIHLVYLGVSHTEVNKKSCQQYIEKSGLDDKAFRLVIIGRVEEGKGQHLVVEAVKKLKNKGLNIQLAIIGHIMDDDYYDSLQNLIKSNNLTENVFYLGFHDDPTSIMACFDAVVLATKCETFGLVLPEAMRAGVAVIGSNCGGVPEIIKHEETGLLFETGNVDDLAIQLSKIVSNSKYCEELAKAGKKEADERFSEEKHFAKLVDVFESL